MVYKNYIHASNTKISQSVSPVPGTNLASLKCLYGNWSKWYGKRGLKLNRTIFHMTLEDFRYTYGVLSEGHLLNIIFLIKR